MSETSSSEWTRVEPRGRKAPKAPVKEEVKADNSLAAKVKNAYRYGSIPCDRIEHFNLVRKSEGDKTFSTVEPKPSWLIFKYMKVGAKAECQCEMDACRAQWNARVDADTRTGDVVAPGSFVKGVVSKKDAEANHYKRVVKLNYALNSEQFSLLSRDFPEYHFITGEEAHDHAVAHTRTLIGSQQLMSKLPREGRVLDLHGNPAHDLATSTRKVGLRVDTLVERATAHDFIRAATKWGAWEGRTEWDAEGQTTCETSIEELIAGDTALGQNLAEYGTFMSIHTLYYYTKQQIAELLSRKKGSSLVALVSRHDGIKGTLNNGEQSYEERDELVQINVETGFNYSHPPVSWLFGGNDMWTQTDGPGFAWDLKKVCESLWIVTMVGIPAHATPKSSKALPMPKIDEATKSVVLDGVCTIQVGNESLKLEVSAPTSFEALRLHASGKERTAETFKVHLAATKRTLKKNGEETAQASSVALASFLVDAPKDLAVMAAGLGDSEPLRRQLNNFVKGQNVLGMKNALDKLLAIGIFVAATRNKEKGTQIATGLRMLRELVGSDGLRMA
jgi:hypothetical protein